MFKSFLLVFILFPIVVYIGSLICFIFLNPMMANDLPLGIIVLTSTITGIYFGRRHAKKSDLPDNFAWRYCPILAPMALIIIVRIFNGTFTENTFPYYYSYYFKDALTIILALCYVPLVISFAASVPQEKKLSNMKWRWQTCIFVIALYVILLCQNDMFVITIRQAKLNFTILESAGETMIDADGVMVRRYLPWQENNRLTKLNVPASLLLNGDFPTIDGATSFVPIYSAVVNETYQVDSKNDLQNYMMYSRTEEAYNRLIRGEADMIFVFQPSDGHLAAAKEAGIELRLTPIAREAFVFFVNRHNPVSDLSLEQIQDIYTNRITNWQQVGGDDKKILPFQRPENSGSQTAMIKDVMKGKELLPPLKAEHIEGTMSGMFRVIAKYRAEEESIGYSFRFYAQIMVDFREHSSRRNLFFRDSRHWLLFPVPTPPDNNPVKLLSVNGITPTVENIRNGRYPFTQDVFVVTAGTSNPRVNELIEWLLSPQGQELIEKVGYVGVK